MRLDTVDAAFCAAAERWLGSLDDATVADLREVFARSPGYYPTTLIALWCKEIERRRLKLVADGTSSRSRPARLPVSHPLDYDWRFTADTAEALTARTLKHVGPGGCVVHIGTPSTFVLGIERSDGLRHVLLERNPAIVAVLAERAVSPHEVICLDVAENEPPWLAAEAAILDPPWYVSDTFAFLAAGAKVCRDGARLWLCQPTLATRPGVDIDRAALGDALPNLGLEVVAVQVGAVRYRMPHFEAMSLRLTEAGLAVPHDWRVGDLVELRRVAAPRARAGDGR